MLTQKQYEAVGGLTLGFNEIEFAFELYRNCLLGTEVSTMQEVMARRATFQQKAKRFKNVLEETRQKWPPLGAQIQYVIAFVEKGQEVAQKRNEYVHALVYHDYAKNETRLQTREAIKECDETEITNLALRAEEIAHKLCEHCGDLLSEIAKLRGLN